MGKIETTTLAIRSACAPGACTPEGSAKAGGRKPAIVATAVSAAGVIVKFTAAFLSGSSAMIAEGIHSMVDAANAGMLLYGMRKANRKADDEHPFGYSRELYFWTLISGIMLFTLGGGLSIVEGVTHILNIDPAASLENPWLSYLVLGISMVVEGYALAVTVRAFNRDRRGKRALRYLKEARDPSLVSVLLEDLSDELSLVIAFIGTLVAHITGSLYADAVASILIGALLCGMTFTLLHKTKELLVGRGMTPDDLDEVQGIVNAHADVEDCTRALSLYLGPNDLLLTIEATFASNASPARIASSIHEIETAIIERFPQAKRIFIEPQPT